MMSIKIVKKISENQPESGDPDSDKNTEIATCRSAQSSNSGLTSMMMPVWLSSTTNWCRRYLTQRWMPQL